MTIIRAVRGEEFPREFTKEVNDFGDWTQLEPLFKELEEEIRDLQTPQELAVWLLQESELSAAIEEEHSRRYIAMTCATDDPDRERAYLDFLENVLPRVKPWHDRLARGYLASPARGALDENGRRRLAVLDRTLDNQVRLFREENVPLQTEDAKLGQQYQKISGAMTVMWEDRELTLQQMAPYFEENDRAVREAAWRATAARRLQDRDALDDLFNRMIDLRTRVARNAGFDNFRDYQHQAYNRFDYTPADTETFHRAVEQEVVPLLADLRRRRRERLGVDALRPWDLQVDPEGRPPLKPFTTARELEAGCTAIFGLLDGALASQFNDMRERGLLDLASRKGKAPGGYQATLDEVRLPFIFMNAAGTHRDVSTLLHEGGHAFHAFAARKEPLLAYRSAPMEFCEVASMAMEVFGLSNLDVFYDDAADVARAGRRHLEELVEIFPWIATIDAFQHWIYLNPDHTTAQREDRWLELTDRFGPGIDWTDLDAEKRSQWQRQLHLYLHPFYYIEYGIAQIGALQLWLQFRNNPERTLANYRRALALGGSRPLPDLFAAAGIRFDFSAETLRPIVEAVAEAIQAAAP
ncbi:MAG: M3 family oligoendopeptidase [bacterium]|nr:M3 family oligoendopeptidase [bacterium]